MSERRQRGSDRSVGQRYLTVSAVARLLNDTLEECFPQLLFRGEISQVTVPKSGHLYFTIKDEGAQLACVMWAGMVRALPFRPTEGLAVLCYGRPNLYPVSGRFQIVVHQLIEEGEGALRRRFEELRARLERDGFFAPERKRPLPVLPRAVGLVTSKSGAVLHDVMVKIRERFPAMVVYLAETRVQGDGAAEEVAAAIRRLDRSGLVDVIIVARGGGSLEDLWAFNEEVVVRAVFGCSRPVVSGVGHEVDTTLCDLAADVRAPTPTAAAELVVPKVSDLLRWIGELERRLRRYDRWLQPRAQRIDELSLRLDSLLSNRIAQARWRLKAAEAAHTGIRPDRVLEVLQSRVERLEGRLTGVMRAAVQRWCGELDRLADGMRRGVAQQPLRERLGVLEGFEHRLRWAVGQRVQQWSSRVEALAARNEALNPRRVLERGFAIVSSHGRPVRSVAGLTVGDEVVISMADGVVASTVTGVEREEQSDG